MAQGENGFKLIKAARLIDGNGGPPAERAAILLEGDRIRALGTEETEIIRPAVSALKICAPP